MKYLWVFLTACLVGIIYYNSSLPLKQSSEISSWFAALTHFCEFALLGLLLCRSFSAWGVPKLTATGYILFLALLVAVIDEYIQAFSPGRASRVKDVLLDFSGGFCAWLEYRILEWSARK